MIKNERGIVVPDDYSKYEQMKLLRDIKAQLATLENRIASLEQRGTNGNI